MRSTEWNCELVTDLAAKGARFRKSEVVGIGRCASADKTGLGGYKSEMLFIAAARGFRERNARAIGLTVFPPFY